MSKFYFTYGNDPQFPYQGGWTEVEAPNIGLAVKAFKCIHPNRTKTNTLNCASCYTSEQFESPNNTMLNGNYGKKCQERITLTREVFGNE